MRRVQSTDAKARLPELLSAVERGETIVIIRHGRAIARIVPEADVQRAEPLRAMERIRAFREMMPRLALDEISCRDTKPQILNAVRCGVRRPSRGD